MKLMVTGGCGFLGSNLAAHAVAQRIDLCVFDNLYRSGSQSNLLWLQTQGKFKFVHGDVRNANDLRRAVADFAPDVVFHLAGQVAMTTSIQNPRMDFEINALGTVNLLEAVREFTPNAGIIYSSTNKVYGDLEQYTYDETESRYVCRDKPYGFDETTPLDFHSPYGCSKGSADQYLRDYHRMFGVKTIVFRHSSMYGGRQFATYDQGWVGWFCQKAVDARRGGKERFAISGNGKQVRDVLHADDMVGLYFSAARKLEAVAGEAFNIGGGIRNSLSLLELLDGLGGLIGCPLAYERLPPRESDQRVFVADISKAKAAFEWSPVVSAMDGVARMIEWVDRSGHTPG